MHQIRARLAIARTAQQNSSRALRNVAKLDELFRHVSVVFVA